MIRSHSLRTAPLHRTARRGVIFITALAIIIILTSLVLVFAQGMRTEATASANRLSAAQANAVEQGAEMWVLAQVESYPADAVTITQVPAQALQVGGGYFWILHPDPLQNQTYAFGITDESSKLNINEATSDQLRLLPGISDASTDPDLADSIVNWVASGDSAPSSNGAQSDYYLSLPEPYQCKSAPFESVEEVLLVKGVTPQLLYGEDLNHDGVIDAAEQTAAGAGVSFNQISESRGIFNDVTCYTTEPNTTSTGGARINVNNRYTSGLNKLLTKLLSSSSATAVMSRVNAVMAGNHSSVVFPTIGDFYVQSGMTADDFALVADQLTATNNAVLPGLINVNTAPAEVLETLPGISQSDATSLVSQRSSGAKTGSIAWVFTALSSTKAQSIAGQITARSFQYSADIVAVSGDGRAFKRVRIVVDSRKSPSKIVYRKDLTYLGWPLPPEVRTSMRNGLGIPDSVQSVGGSLQHALK